MGLALPRHQNRARALLIHVDAEVNTVLAHRTQQYLKTSSGRASQSGGLSWGARLVHYLQIRVMHHVRKMKDKNQI